MGILNDRHGQDANRIFVRSGRAARVATRVARADNSRYACGVKLTGIAPAIFFAASLAAQSAAPPVLWTNGFVSQFISSPAVAPDGTVYAGGCDGQLHAVGADGQVRWSFATPSEIISSPAVGADGTVYFGSRDKNFYALTPQGRLKWRFAAGGWVDSSPAIAGDGTIYFGSWDKNFYALNPDGSRKWAFATGGIVDSSAAIASDGTVYFGSHDKNFYALNRDGSKRWAFASGSQIVASPAIGADGTVYFTAVNGKLFALNPDGTEKWALTTGGVTKSSPVLDADGRLCLAANTSVTFVGTNGGVVARYGNDADIAGAPVFAADGSAIVTTRNGYCFAVDRLNNAPWSLHFFGVCSGSPVLDENGRLIFGNENGTLVALKLGMPAAKSAWPMFGHDARHTGNAAGK